MREVCHEFARSEGGRPSWLYASGILHDRRHRDTGYPPPVREHSPHLTAEHTEFFSKPRGAKRRHKRTRSDPSAAPESRPRHF